MTSEVQEVMSSLSPLEGHIFLGKGFYSLEGANQRGSDLGVTRHSFPGEGNGNPPQYSCLENPMEPGRLQSMGSQESDTTERLSTHRHSFKIGGPTKLF